MTGQHRDKGPADGPNRPRLYLLLHALLVVYSLTGVTNKLASGYAFPSAGFIGFYSCGIAFLGIYAIGWQQVIKHLPLTTAYANRAITILWGIVWGALLFHEEINAFKVCGALIVLVGVALYAKADALGARGGDA